MPSAMSGPQLESLWRSLALPEAARAWCARQALLDVPDQAVALLSRKLRAAFYRLPKKLIAELDADDYATHTTASAP